MLELASLASAISHFLAEEIRQDRANGVRVSRAVATKLLPNYLAQARAILQTFPATEGGSSLEDVFEAMTAPAEPQEGQGGAPVDPNVPGDPSNGA